MELVSVSEALDYIDGLGDQWRKYQIGVTEARTVGDWTLEPFSIERDDAWRLRYILEGGIDRDPGWGEFTRLVHKGQLWMSDTRAEIMEHSPLINRLWWTEGQSGRTVLINGLGMGMAVQACLAHAVEHVDVVEIDKDVIDLVGPTFAGKPVTIHHADAYEITWPRGHSWTLAWHDIWQSISDENLDGMDRLAKKYRRHVEWQDSWQRGGCLAMRDHINQIKQSKEGA